MAFASLGAFAIPIGPGASIAQSNPAVFNFVTMDAANEAIIFMGQIATSDGGSHTIDTTGSSSLGWLTGTCTWANGGSTVKVGLAAVDTANGPPGRAANASNVITFDVSKSLTGGSGITSDAWQTHVPDTGSKTIANGDFVAFAVQMTARGGTDSVLAAYQVSSGIQWHRPLVTSYIGAAYAAVSGSGVPNMIITFADGALGFMGDGDVFKSIQQRNFNSSQPTKEYGQLFQLPFPLKIYGIYVWAVPNSNFDVVLYSDPLGTPVAEKTVSFNAFTGASGAGRRTSLYFSSPYSTTESQVIAIAGKPGTGGMTIYYKTLANASHRIADAWGTTGYGISRGTGAFSNSNASLDHFYMGLLAGAFDAGGVAGRAVQINNDSLVA